MSAATPLLFNALNGREVMEIILRKVRENFEADNRFRQCTTYPNLKYSFSLKMNYEPGAQTKVDVMGNADLRGKLQAQADRITRLEAQEKERQEKFEAIETEAGVLLTEVDRLKADLADANDFIKKLHAEKLELQNQVVPNVTIEPNIQDDIEALISGGGAIEIGHQSEVIEEPDRLRDEGVTTAPAEEVEISGGGEAMGEAETHGITIGRQPSEVTVVDEGGKAISMSAVRPARGAVVEHGRAPGAVVGPPKGRR